MGRDTGQGTLPHIQYNVSKSCTCIARLILDKITQKKVIASINWIMVLHIHVHVSPSGLTLFMALITTAHTRRCLLEIYLIENRTKQSERWQWDGSNTLLVLCTQDLDPLLPTPHSQHRAEHTASTVQSTQPAPCKTTNVYRGSLRKNLTNGQVT